MKIMAIMGSPRKGSNVDILIDKVIEGVKSKTDVEAEKVYIYESDIKYCTGCGAHSILQGAKTVRLEMIWTVSSSACSRQMLLFLDHLITAGLFPRV